MRQSYKTSTAIVTILSLLMPTVTFAQETPAEQTPATQAAPTENADAAAEAAAAEAQPKKLKKAKAEAEAAVEAAAPVVDETPAAKPEAVKAEAPETKPADAAAKAEKAEAIAKEAEKKPAKAAREAVETLAPEAKPAVAETIDTPAPAPVAKKAEAAAEAAKAEAEGNAAAVTDKAAKAAAKAKAKVEEVVPPAEPKAAAVDDVKKALEAEAGKAAKAVDKTKEAVAVTPADTGKAAGESEDALKKALQAEADKGKAKAGDAAAAAAAAAGEATDKAKAAAAAAAETGKDILPKDVAQPAADTKDAAKPKPPVEEVAAPEAAAQETDAAIAAANPKKVEPNDALMALLAGKTGDGKVTDVTVSQDDARRSDQDFETSVTQSITEALGGKTEAKKDNTGRDLARLALAGMAGYAVGTMLSNNQQVALNTGDRVVVTNPDGSQQLIKNDDALLFRPGSNVQTEQFSDGSTITTVLREDGSKVMTIRDANMNVLRRSVVWPDGRQTMLIDDTVDVKPVRVSELPPPARPIAYDNGMSEEALRQALMQESRVDRRFSLDQIRDIAQVRALVAPLDIQSITFATGSSAIRPEQARQLSALGRAIADSINKNRGELFLIEGYTDAVGSAASNLALSDRRAESVALALTEYFNVPPENLVVQGYGKQFLKIQTDGPEEANRRVAVRRITDLIEQK